MSELKVIPPDAKSFMANGKEYFIEGGLSFERWMEQQQLDPEIGLNATFDGFFKSVKKVYGHLNSREGLADAAVDCHNIMAGIASLDRSRTPSILKLCALFVNTKDEDRTIITEAMVAEKVKDWSVEGIEVASFFRLALGSIPGFLSAYDEITKSGLKQAREITGQPPTTTELRA